MFKNTNPIKSWAEDDRPREKMELKGKSSLSDTELLAILISTGTAKKTAVDLAREVLNAAGNDLNALAKMSIKDLCKLNGIGKAKAISIAAAIELGGRRNATEHRQKKTISGSKDAYEYIRWRLEDLQYEEFWILTLNRANKVINEHRVSEGGVSGTVVDPKRVYKFALDDTASSIILFHNHPSGTLKPSSSDISLTKKLKEAGSLLEISILDHIIVCQAGYYSFADEGIL